MNEVEVIITGKDTGAADTMKRTRQETDKLGEGFDKAGGHADDAESKLIGLHDTVDGLGAVMKGPGEQGMVSYIQGFADLAGGVATFVIPALKTLTKATITAAKEHVVNAARVTASWVVMATQATINAARMAVAWVIALGPVALIVAGLVALGVALAVAWKKSETFRNIVHGAISTVAGIFKTLADWAEKAWNFMKKIADIGGIVASAVGKIGGAFKAAGAWIGGAAKSLWSFVSGGEELVPMLPAILKGLGQAAADANRGRGGTDRRRGYAGGGIAGGVVDVGEYGREMVRLPWGSTVYSHGTGPVGAAAGGPVRVVVEYAGGGGAGDDLWRWVRTQVRVRGGVERAFGGA